MKQKEQNQIENQELVEIKIKNVQGNFKLNARFILPYKAVGQILQYISQFDIKTRKPYIKSSKLVNYDKRKPKPNRKG